MLTSNVGNNKQANFQPLKFNINITLFSNKPALQPSNLFFFITWKTMVKDELRDKFQFSGPHTPVLDLYQNSTLLRESIMM